MADTERLRNIGVISHGGGGKTSLCEAILFNAKTIDRLGKTTEGNTVMDYEPEEISRNISISSSVAFCNWNGYRLNIIDTPGYINFIEDTRGCLRGVDGAVVIISAISGVKAETEKVWRYATDYEIPRIAFVNKMDRERADFLRAIGDMKKAFGIDSLPVEFPIGAENAFVGVVDLITMKAFIFEKDLSGKFREEAIPEEIRGDVEEQRKRLIEKIAEGDDTLLEKYLEGGELTEEEILKGLKEGTLRGRFVPVTCGSAAKNIGVQQLLDFIIKCLPSPMEKAMITPIKGIDPKSGKTATRKPESSETFSALVFKTIADPYAGRLTLFRVYSGMLKADSTIYNSTQDKKEKIGQVFYLIGKKQIPAQVVKAGDIAVVAKLKDTITGDTICDEGNAIRFPEIKFADPVISFAIAPKSKGDEEKVSNGIHRLLEEDPTLRFYRDDETKEMILSGMGQVHLEVTLERLKRKFGVEVAMKTPKIPYKETIKTSAKAQGKYKKQSGGRGQYGDTWIEIEPLPKGSGFEFVDKIVGGVIPRQYIPAVEKGVVGAMHEGVVAGYPLVDIRVTLYDGSYHTVDSSEMAFKIAGSMALRKAALEAKPVILEPIMNVEVVTPEDSLGAVIGDLNSRRGKVQGVQPQTNNQKVIAQVPMAEMLSYAPTLNSLTSGRGIYSVEFSHYEEVPGHLSAKITAEREKHRKEKEE